MMAGSTFVPTQDTRRRPHVRSFCPCSSVAVDGASARHQIRGALVAAALYTGIVLKPQDRIEERPIDTLS